MQHDGFPPSSVVSAVPLWRFIPSQLMGHGSSSALFFCPRKSRVAAGFDRPPSNSQVAMEETYRALNPLPGSALFVAQSAKTNKSAGDLKWRCNTGETPSRKVPIFCAR
ncbi:hypothetical protein ELI03_27770 (plasmid) [Rhizobium leguminosarum]|uniref:Uncharacterized protein n=1 Tax=Rhizobium leguminosarum TaxID=384 RepID=A0A4Q8XSE8_RHILE|nr:hypothetical protein ELI03_27770 [Rhizobium leguminosarum]